MANETGPTARERIDTAIDEILPAEIKNLPDIATPAEISRRRWFGASMLILAAFCMAVAAAPWPGKGIFDLATWATYSIVLLLVGAWQISRASRDDLGAERSTLVLDSDTLAEGDQERTLRRVK